MPDEQQDVEGRRGDADEVLDPAALR